MTDDLLRELIGEVRGLRADLRRQNATAEARAAVVDAIRSALGRGRWTWGGLIELAADEPALADALSLVVDITARGAAIALNLRFAHHPEIEQVDTQRGVQVFRLRD